MESIFAPALPIGIRNQGPSTAFLTWISHKRVTNLVCAVSLLRRIALRRVAVLSSTGFSLCTVNGPQLKPHRPARPAGGLKPVLLDRPRPALSLFSVNPLETSKEFM